MDSLSPGLMPRLLIYDRDLLCHISITGTQYSALLLNSQVVDLMKSLSTPTYLVVKILEYSQVQAYAHDSQPRDFIKVSKLQETSEQLEPLQGK